MTSVRKRTTTGTTGDRLTLKVEMSMGSLSVNVREENVSQILIEFDSGESPFRDGRTY